MKKRLLFVFNPQAGKAQIKNQLLGIVDTMVKGGWEVVVHPTQYRLDAQRAAREEAQHYDLLVCSGGDGTLNETVCGLMRNPGRPPLGYIPAGTVNDFARSLKLPRNMKQAARTALEGTPFRCDVGSFNDGFFTYVAAFGAFTEVSYQTPQPFKNMLGRAAYLVEGMKRVGSLKPFALRLESGDLVLEDEFVFGMVTNATSVGGFKEPGRKQIRMDDGLFEATLVKMPRSAAELQRIVNSLLTGDPDRELIRVFKTGRLQISAQEELPWTLDGEFGGSPRDILIENHSRALEILTGRPPEKP